MRQSSMPNRLPAGADEIRKCPKCPFGGNREPKGAGALRGKCARCRALKRTTAEAPGTASNSTFGHGVSTTGSDVGRQGSQTAEQLKGKKGSKGEAGDEDTTAPDAAPCSEAEAKRRV